LVQAAPRGEANVGSETPKEFPQSIIDGLLALRGDGNLGRNSMPAIHPWQRKVPWASDAAQCLYAAAEENTKAVGEENAADPHYRLIARLPEYAVRLATLHAMGRVPGDPSVGEADLDWGFAFVIASSKALMDGAEHNIAETPYARDQNDLFNRIRDAGEEGISERALKRAFSASSKRTLSSWSDTCRRSIKSPPGTRKITVAADRIGKSTGHRSSSKPREEPLTQNAHKWIFTGSAVGASRR
jgi:hypothetical protein